MMVNTLVDQYLENELSPRDRKKAEHYFFNTEQRREKLKFAAALKRRKAELLRKKKRRETGGHYLRAAAIALVAIGAGAFILKTYLARPSLAEGLNALQRAYRDGRPVESRISGFSYAPAPNARGETANVDSTQRSLAATIILGILDKQRENAGADVYEAAGKYYLSQRRFDEAVKHFERALELDQKNSRVHSDLGAALLERGETHSSELEYGEKNQDFGNSLIHLNKALELDSTNLEALFNRALLYKQMDLLPQSEKDWRQYIERDPNSQWADEARTQLTRIEQQRAQTPLDPFKDFFDAYKRGDQGGAWEIVRRNYSSAGNTIANTLLDAYLDADGKSDSATAQDKLDTLAFLGKVEFDNAADVYTSELVRFYKGSSFQKRRLLGGAREQMANGYDLFLRSHVDDALNQYSQAEKTFRENADHGEAALALYRIGHCHLLEPDLKKSEQIFTHLREIAARSNYKWLLNQTIYRTASIRFTLNDYSESVEFAKQALTQSEQMGDVTGVVNALIMLSDQYRALNDQNTSWGYLSRAQSLTRDAGGEPLQAWGILTAIAYNLKVKLPEMALEYQKEALRLALDLKPERPLIISRSYDYLGQTYAKLKNYEVAVNNINLGFEYGRQLADERSGIEMMGNTSLHAGDVYREANQHSNAINSYENSIKFYQQIDYPYFTYPARKGKLLSYWALGDDAATEAELNSVLKIFDEYRSKLNRESQRNTFFNDEQDVYDLAIDFAWTKKNDRELAFKFAELSRARSLLDAMNNDSQDVKTGKEAELPLIATATPLSPSEISGRLPDDAQIIQYGVLSDKVLMWVITRNGIKAEEKKIRSDELESKINKFITAISSLPRDREPTFQGDAIELHKLLIAPIESLLDKDKLTCIVADKALHYVPFEALISEATGEYVVEKFRLQSAPSSSIFLSSLGTEDAHAEHDEERVLSVGDPLFDRRAFPSLQALPDARDEAKAVAALYDPPRTLLLDRDATERAVRSGLEKANVAHLAGHYVVDERHSLFSKLLLTPPSKTADKDDDGLLQVHEIYRLDLAHIRLVVLSACQTGIERQYGGEGAIGAARPFIAAGARLVVASLWPVDSSSTAQLMTAFHRFRTEEKYPSVRALQQAQLSLLRGDDKRYRHPYYWAAFTVIGRYEKF